MTTALADHLIEKINWHRTWLMAMDFGTEAMTVSVSDTGIRKCICKNFRFEVRVGMNGYDRGMILSIPESRFDASISSIAAIDGGFKNRLDTLSLTFKDINRLFGLATWNAISLGLEA